MNIIYIKTSFIYIKNLNLLQSKDYNNISLIFLFVTVLNFLNKIKNILMKKLSNINNKKF